jgi:hypothetical protein
VPVRARTGLPRDLGWGVGGEPDTWLHANVSQYPQKWCSHFGTQCPSRLRCHSSSTYSPSTFVNLTYVSPMPELGYGVHAAPELVEHVVLLQLAQTPKVHPITTPHTFHTCQTFQAGVWHGCNCHTYHSPITHKTGIMAASLILEHATCQTILLHPTHIGRG